MLKTGHRSKYHLRAFEFLAARRRSRAVLTCTLLASFLATMPTGGLQAGDILRGGASVGNAKRNSEARANAGAAAAEAAKVRAQDRLARTTKAVNDMRALQASARAAAAANTIPNGLTEGGLKVLTGANAKWEGANPAAQSGNTVGITQTAAQALLHWETFNVGSQTTVNFDQSAGGVDSGKWIAFNKVLGTAAPSQIRGKINAQGQVYIINQNGIIFGAGSQVNARTLVASALPINDNLIKNGLLNNKDAQFLFSGLSVPGGSDGTPPFTPDPLPTGAKYGDVVVEAGALLAGPVSADGNGGRIMLVGANVRNDGQISTPAGQTILAAGLQLAIASHDSSDPSLRGLDVWVGDVGNYAGTASNNGLIEAPTGSVWMTGKSVNQSGIIDSSTSVNLNGRIDLIASYGAVANPNFDNKNTDGFGGPAFLNQFTGGVTFSPFSVTRILPDYASTATVPGTALPQRSQINIQGRSIALLRDSNILAPNAKVTFQAGNWAYTDVDSNRTIFKADGKTAEDGLVSNFQGSKQKMFYSAGQVFMAPKSLLDVSGTTDAFVPLSQSIQTVQLRGTELADSPLQRDSMIRGKDIVVDLRKSGTFNNVAWIGTPLGDLTSLSGVTQRNVSQLTAEGGTVAMQAGGSIIIQNESTIDVSGGFYRHEGGKVSTSRLLRKGNLVKIENATPDVTYDGIYDGRSARTSTKWGVTKTYASALAPLGSYTDQGHIAGANGGSINLTAPSLSIGGNLRGQTITGPLQLDAPATMSTLSMTFQGEARYVDVNDPKEIRFYRNSPSAPTIVFTNSPRNISTPLTPIENLLPLNTVSSSSLPIANRLDAASSGDQFDLNTAWWTPEGGGFGHILLDNRDGALQIDKNVSVNIPAGGSLSARASNVQMQGSIRAPGGTVELTAYNISPYKYLELDKTNQLINEPAPDPKVGRGTIALGGSASIDVSGMLVDDRFTSREVTTTPRALNGGTVSLEAYNIRMDEGSSINASGGAYAKINNSISYGTGGKISLLAGRDPDFSTVTGGSLKLGGRLSAYSATTGGSLSLRANLIQIGGVSNEPSMLVLAPEFFRQGGFTGYSLTGIGKSTKPALSATEKKNALANPVPTPTPVPGEDPSEDSYIPAIRIVEGTIIEPVAEQWQVQPPNKNDWKLTLKPMLKSEGERKPVSLKLAASGADDSYTTNFIEARGDIVIGKNSLIRTDAGGSVLIGTDENLQNRLADTVSLEGTIIAPGGTVAIFTRGEFRLSGDVKLTRSYALPTIYLGPQATISTAGKVVRTPDSFGRRTGSIYSGGRISIKGNIVAEAGAVLDVSGTSGIFDVLASQSRPASTKPVPITAGLNSLPSNRQTIATKIDTDGGLLELHGSEMLFSDATLLGRAGGPTAKGGTLSIFSGRYYKDGVARTSADINLVVSQSQQSLAGTSPQRGVGLKVKYANNVTVNKVPYLKNDPVPAMGYFAADSFNKGGFESLDLGYEFLETATPIPYGGNVEFRGPVTINAPGLLRVAGGGVIRSDSPVNLTARYIAVGQKFRAPVNPLDAPFVAFQKNPADPVLGANYYHRPTYGSTGSVNFSAGLIDIGTTVFETTGKVSFTANNGDIRGDGTLSVAGDITMAAGQIYPSTLAQFNIFAYDYTDEAGKPGKGSVRIAGSGNRPLPYSAGGSLSIFASSIYQGGTLRAPFGSISLGWDGTDYDLSTTAFDSPLNTVVRTRLTVPTTSSVTLAGGSITSVSAIDPLTGNELTIPYGISTDGLSWYDPRGVNVTTSGLPEKRVAIGAESVSTESGSQIDLRGGGDLLAYRWVSGPGGSRDLLGESIGNWSEANSYEAGAIVSYNGKTWSARRAIKPSDFSNTATASAKKSFILAKSLTASIDSITPAPPAPLAGSTYWSEMKDSYAVLPGFAASYAPQAGYNKGQNAVVLKGDTGLQSSSLSLGDRVYLEGIDSLPDGSYTLLPRRFAVMPGAHLITPVTGGTQSRFNTVSGALETSGFQVTGKTSGPFARATTPSGSLRASGRLGNEMSGASLPETRSLFEVTPPTVLADQVKYEVYSANKFMSDAAKRVDLATVQRLPMDSGSLAIQGNSALKLNGGVLSSYPTGGRGARIDISSDSDMYIVGGTGTAPAGARVVLSSEILSSWGAESLLIGGLRRATEDAMIVGVRAPTVTLNNPGTSLSSPEVTLAARRALTVAPRSSIESSAPLTQAPDTFSLTGEGALIRVSGNKRAATVRSAFTDSVNPIMTIGSGATISGAGVILDSSYATSLSAEATIKAAHLTLLSGQISLLLDGAPPTLAGSAVPNHLNIVGRFPGSVQSLESLTLASYRTIDIYGSGSFGSANLGFLKLYGSAIRGFDRGAVTLRADDVTIGNPSSSKSLAAPAGGVSASLDISANTVGLAANAFRIDGYSALNINAARGLAATGSGSLTLPGSLSITAPLITGSRGVSYNVAADGAVSLLSGGGSPNVTSGLGATLQFTGSSILSTTAIRLPSGSVTLQATNGDVTVGSEINVAGSSRSFYDITRYSDGGLIRLLSDNGAVVLNAGSVLDVSAHPGGGGAGTIDIGSAQSAFVNNGQLLGSASSGNRGGSFLLDTRSISSFASINSPLEQGGFSEERNIRVRTGNVLVNQTARARSFSLSADAGSITLDSNARIDASGTTGGTIAIAARDDVTLQRGSVLTVAAQKFDNAGKGGSIRIEAGSASNGSANASTLLNLQNGSTIDLSVAEFVAGDYTTVGSSAFFGRATGRLHLRAPRIGNDVQISQIQSTITGASSIIVEPYKVYDRSPTGTMDTFLRTEINTEATNFMNVGEAAMRTRLLTGTPNAASVGAVLVITPGVEIFSTGDLILGVANNDLNNPTTDAEALSGADWDLSTFRYRLKNEAMPTEAMIAPGILTLRAKGNLIFNNTLSDGFTPIAQGTPANFANIGHSQMWLATLQTINKDLPINTQSWSYRLTSGSDLAAADFRSVLRTSLLTPTKGSILVGEFYPAVPNNLSSGLAAAIGTPGQTADTIRISTTNTNLGTRFEVVRTGTGDIVVSSGRDIQLRNQFATIYTAGVALPTPTTVYTAFDFVVPTLDKVPSQGGASVTLGARQQVYNPIWAMSGGDVVLSARENIGRYTQVGGVTTVDSSRQTPTNWLYRRGYIDPSTGRFASDLGFGTLGIDALNVIVTDTAASTAWWIDYSNFFEGVGALGGGNVRMDARSGIINVDAAIPTNARMQGRSQALNRTLSPSEAKILELGGGDLVVRTDGDLSGGAYYVERGTGRISARGGITTNAARSPQLGILDDSGTATYDSAAWTPTLLFAGSSSFEVTANKDITIGPAINPFLMPQGQNNKFWYKTYFNTYSPSSGVDIMSIGGGVTHRNAATLTGGSSAISVLDNWFSSQNLFVGEASEGNAAHYQPWLRLAEMDLANFADVFKLSAPRLRSTAFSGDIRLVGSMTLYPSATGTLELAASDGILGLQPSGKGAVDGASRTIWTSSTINVSDANPSNLPGILTPIGYQTFVGRSRSGAVMSDFNPYRSLSAALNESGAFSDSASARALHSASLLHTGDANPVRLYASGGSISGLTLFSPKFSRILANKDITDIAFYIQNVAKENVTIISAGGDIIPYNENSPLRALASNSAKGNAIGDPRKRTSTDTLSSTLAGDIQINGPGYLEILAGRNIDLGTGPNYTDGTGVGITSVGNYRNPFLPFTGASIIAMAGVKGSSGGAALGLAGSTLNFKTLESSANPSNQVYASKEVEYITLLNSFFKLLQKAGNESETTGSYNTGFAAISNLFGSTSSPSGTGEIFTRARDIRTSTGGAITIAAPAGGLTMASDIFGSPKTPPGIVTEYGGAVSIFTRGNVEIGRTRIFTLRGGDISIWSSQGDIAAGTSPKTVVTAPPTRVVIDTTSADVATDLGGLATGGGIGVLASVKGVPEGSVYLIAPAGTVDAGDAGIAATGDIKIAAAAVVNADNISAGGSTSGVPSAPTVAAPSIGGLTSASSSTAATSSAAESVARQPANKQEVVETPSLITVEVLGYGGGEEE